MSLLTDEIAKLRVRLADAHGNEMYATARLAAEVARQREELDREVGALIAAHEQGRVRLVEQLVELARRVGGLPSPVYPLPMAGPAVATIAGDGPALSSLPPVSGIIQ